MAEAYQEPASHFFRVSQLCSRSVFHLEIAGISKDACTLKTGKRRDTDAWPRLKKLLGGVTR